MSNGAASEAGWSTPSDWSLAASRQPSRTSTPAPKISSLTIPSSSTSSIDSHEDTKPIADFASWMKSAEAQHIFAQAQTSQTNWLLPSRAPDDPASFDFVAPRPRGKTHVPRPPNAFMLFRAEKVNAELPRDLPNRQQVVSVVAGQCWNMLDEAGKAEWHARAREMLKKHMERYPDYKFAPSRKSTRKKAEEVEVKDGEEYIRHLREKYMNMVGPSVASTRARKPRSRKGRAAPDVQPPLPSSSRLPSMNPTTGPLSSYPMDSSFGAFGHYPPHLYQSYGQNQMPMQSSAPYMGSHQEIDFAALSASYMQGSSRNTTPSPVPSSSSCSGSSAGSAEEEATPVVDHDKTPTAATFGHITIPRVPNVPNISHFANTNHMLGLHELSPYPNMFQQQHSTQMQASGSSMSSSCRLPPQDPAAAAAYYSAIFPPSMHQSHSVDGSTSSAPSATIPSEVRETFGVKGNPGPV
ncbi:hypothetical protein EUX98_g5044 [Antrodiella citrinella]|uniref:HMG box domain-containing protein n=1 Tax=Antrodiella citrinella TaxID=2447956 RepID=A0A4S4MSQ8_9APHY|nr:hypothetical protein EUX98_g5044 [Antrodiella citrinella]